MEIKSCKEVIEKDYKMLEQLLLPITLKEIKKIKRTYMQKYLRYYVEHRLNQYIKRSLHVFLYLILLELQ